MARSAHSGGPRRSRRPRTPATLGGMVGGDAVAMVGWSLASVGAAPVVAVSVARWWVGRS